MSSSNEIIVEITAADIDNGIKCSDHLCPVARALSRAFGTEISIGLSTFTVFNGPNPGKTYKVPQEVRDFIIQFDSDIEVQPFTFTFTQSEP